MLHVTAILPVLEKKDHSGKPAPFNFKYVKRGTGEIIEGTNCILTSSHFRPSSVNVQFSNGEMRKLRTILFVELNGIEVYM